MSTKIQEIPKQKSVVSVWSDDQKEVLRKIICPGANDAELELFGMVCKKTGLDPFTRQVYLLKVDGRIVTQTSIDGYRLIADRTGKYAPGADTEFGYKEDGSLHWAKAFVKKLTPDGSWHTISAIAFWDEYVKKIKGNVAYNWKNMPHIMLSKCAEALALRKAFPAELSGIYTADEMEQASSDIHSKTIDLDVEEENDGDDELDALLDDDYVARLNGYIEELDEKRKENFISYIQKRFEIETMEDIKALQAKTLCETIEARKEKSQC